jgi:hypothetical protein
VVGIFMADYEQGDIGHDLFHAACRMGLEGIVSKYRGRLSSRQMQALAQSEEPRASGLRQSERLHWAFDPEPINPGALLRPRKSVNQIGGLRSRTTDPTTLDGAISGCAMGRRRERAIIQRPRWHGAQGERKDVRLSPTPSDKYMIHL